MTRKILGPEKDTGTGSGYITADEYRQLLDRAAQLKIRIVPEIVAPGHSAAAIAAVKNRYDIMDPDQERQVSWNFHQNSNFFYKSPVN